MLFTPTDIAGVFLVDLDRKEDERGFFARAFCAREFEARGIDPRVAQCSLSYNRLRGTLRGLHLQKAPHGETKLVRVVRGAIFDVAVDLRAGSPTFGRWTGVELSADNRRALLIPAGCAHGFQTIADDSEILYQISTFYAPEAGAGVRWDDPEIGVRWPDPAGAILNDRDRTLPLLRDYQP